jgi:hypothetical protein
MKSILSLFFTLFWFLVSGMSSAAMQFPLPEGYFVKAKMPMHLVYPRPDSETQTHARHRWAHPAMEYQIPIGVQGGAWPFKYEIVEGPSGANIGSLYGDDNYGVITWTPTVGSGTAGFKIKITDQEQKVIEATWNVTIDPAMFVFVQAGWTGKKVGTIGEPLGGFSEWYKSSQTDTTYLNKIAVFRGGRYELMGEPGVDNNNVRLLEKSKTPSLIGFPGETPVFDAGKAKVMTDSSKLHDLFVAGITWDNARQDVANAHYWWAVGDVSRATWWRNTFQNIGPGQEGTDNTGPVFVSATIALKKNILYKENTNINVQNMGPNGTYLTVFVASYVLIEQNVAKNSKTTIGWYAKGTVSFVTIRANSAYENVDGTQIGVGYGAEAGQVPHDHEVCWNRIGIKLGSSSPSLLWAGSSYYAGKTYNSYLYRNTLENGSAWIRFPGNEPFEVDANAVVTGILPRWDTSVMLTQTPNLVNIATSGILSAGKVVGESFGKVGHSVAVSAGPDTVPNAKFKTTPVP